MEWCRIFKVNGKQVLFINNDQDEDEKFRIKIIVRADDFIQDSVMYEIALTITSSEKAFTDEQFNKVATQKGAENFISEAIKPLSCEMVD